MSDPRELVAKLLILSEDPGATEHEAKAARLKAAEIAGRYGFDLFEEFQSKRPAWETETQDPREGFWSDGAGGRYRGNSARESYSDRMNRLIEEFYREQRESVRRLDDYHVDAGGNLHRLDEMEVAHLINAMNYFFKEQFRIVAILRLDLTDRSRKLAEAMLEDFQNRIKKLSGEYKRRGLEDPFTAPGGPRLNNSTPQLPNKESN